MRLPRWPRLDGGRSAVTLSDAFRRWVVDNALEGVPATELIDELVKGGVPRPIAAREVAALVRSPAFDACRAQVRRRAQAELVLDLRARILRETKIEIERRTKPSASEFFDRYFAGNRPVVLTDATEGWPARAWTPELLAERLGDAEIEIASRRDADPRPDRNLDAHRERTTVRDYVARLRAAGTSNDLYTVANNKNMDRPELRALLADVRLDEEVFDPERIAGGFSFWLGPAGTVTPLHHDTTNILFHQLHGRKRLLLAPPEERVLLAHAEGYYSALDPEADPLPEALRDVGFHAVELAPGESLFLPAGWWHHVRALDVSISLSQLNFRRPNAYDDYSPGYA